VFKFYLLFLMMTCLSSYVFAGGKEIYLQQCASCHHPDRIGLSGPPLLSETLARSSDKKLMDSIRNGLPNTLMMGFPHLSDEEIKDLIAFIKGKYSFTWNKETILKSRSLSKEAPKKIEIKDQLNLTTVVERGNNLVWVMEDQKILDKFTFSGIHGGIKYTKDNRNFFVPSRDGYIGKYELDRGYYGQVRACISLRNIALSNNQKYLLASCLLPQKMMIVNAVDLSFIKEVPLEGKVSGVYTLVEEDRAVFTYRDKPKIGFFDFTSLKLVHHDLKEPIEDFFIDPLDKFIVGSSRGGKKLSVVDLSNRKVIFDYDISGMPHLSSATYWYDRGQFYFATFHLMTDYITIWKMYDFSFVKKVQVGGNGFFVRSHPKSNHLWIDNGTDEVVLVDKRSHQVEKLKPLPGKRFTHTEFSADGRLAYLSIFETDGSLLVYDTATLKEVGRFDASLPVGKYNVANKERNYLPVLLGESVFMGKCWGCHHQEQSAFGPSFTSIAQKRDKGMIKVHLDGPQVNALNLGYKKATMPDIPLTEEEKEMVAQYIMSFRLAESDLKKITLYNMVNHSLLHPERVVNDCKNYIAWKKLGWSTFTEVDKLEEKKYMKVCE